MVLTRELLHNLLVGFVLVQKSEDLPLHFFVLLSQRPLPNLEDLVLPGLVPLDSGCLPSLNDLWGYGVEMLCLGCSDLPGEPIEDPPGT